MRNRLVVTLVSMTVGILIVFGIAGAYTAVGLGRDQHERALRQQADVVAVAIAAIERDGQPVTPELLAELSGSSGRVTFVDATGAVAEGGADEGDISASRDVAGGGRVTVTGAGFTQSDQLVDALLRLVLLGLVLAAISAIVGRLLARRLASPFRRLADDATRIGEGDFDVDVRHSSIGEAEDLGDALRSAAGQLGTLVKRERELAVVASHELRTPITALRLSLEDLSLWPQTPTEVADELRRSLSEVDRLSDVVSSLLERDDHGHLGAVTEIDLATLAAEAAERWQERAERAGRVVLAGRCDAVATHVVRSSVDHILDVLIENAIEHGSGVVTVDSALVDTYSAIRVADEGPRAFPPGVVHLSPSGGDLTEAATQAESLGGFIGVHDVPTTRVFFALPRAH